MKAKRIAILESRLGEQFVDLVKQRGGVPFHAPALAELPDLDPEQVRALVESLAQEPAKLFVFQTGVGTRALFSVLENLQIADLFLGFLADSKVAVRGPKPAGPLRAKKVRIDYSAAEPFTTLEVLDAIEGLDLQGARVIVQRYGSENVMLDQALDARGARVTEVPTYRWSLPADTGALENLIEALLLGKLDATVFTNAVQVRNLFLVAERTGSVVALREALNRTLVASIGPVASQALLDAEVEVGIEASPPKLGALLAALETALSG